MNEHLLRVEALLAKMTLSEKIGQMTQHALYKGVWEDQAALARIYDQVKQGGIGSFLNARNREVRNELQKTAVEETRLGVPLIFGRDVIHGYKTIFPIPLGLGASFDPELVEKTAHAAAKEAREAGIDWTFAPMVDVARDPRWGRVAEGFGEDAYLTSKLGAAMVRGFQGQDLASRERVAACAKHYVGYGASESGKDYNTTSVPEQLLRELYLPPFKACVDAGVASVMSAFNDLNGIPASGNEWTLRQILKGEFGFPGFVVSDWASLREMIAHGFCADERQVALEGARAGVDMEMASRCYQEHLKTLVESELVPEALIDDAVRRILKVKFALGLFENPYREAPKKSAVLAPEHLALARQAARESFVLMKNEGSILPLAPDLGSLAVIGPLADDSHNVLGCWAYDGEREATVTVLAALKEKLGENVKLTHAKGLETCRSIETGGFEEAVGAVASAELALVILGEDSNISGECKNRAFLDLPGAQLALLEQLAATGTPLVVVFMAGRPLTIGQPCALARAALYAWHPGTMTGPALVDVLFGDVAPSGKLPISFPRTVGQVPIYYNFKNTGRPPKGAARAAPTGTPLDPVDHFTSYLDVDVTPEFPFGFGLSYTSFSCDDLAVSPANAKVGTPIEVSARVTNTGDRDGEEVVQLYVRDRVGSVTRPVRELKGFERVHLLRGESKRITFRLTDDELAFYGRDMRFKTEPGEFQVFVGGSSQAELSGEFTLE